MIWDFFKLAVQNIKERRVRSWLTMLGIFIGIAAIVSLISLGQGLQDAIEEQFEQIGTDKLIIQPAGQSAGPGTTPVELTLDDLKVIRNTNGVTAVSYMILGFGSVSHGGVTRTAYVAGVPLTPEEWRLMEEINDYDIEKGRPLERNDKKKVVLGID